MQGYGDYETPEQFIPVYVPKGPWEFCVTTNDTWSFTGAKELQNSFRNDSYVLRMFGDGAGNMLLNVGPDEHGVIPFEQVRLLEAIGAWIRANEEAVYQVEKGLPHGYAYHFSSDFT